MSPHLWRLFELAPTDVQGGLQSEDWERLGDAYQTPLRRYHNLEHIVEVAEQVKAPT